jgi:hypothetical protein
MNARNWRLDSHIEHSLFIYRPLPMAQPPHVVPKSPHGEPWANFHVCVIYQREIVKEPCFGDLSEYNDPEVQMDCLRS